MTTLIHEFYITKDYILQYFVSTSYTRNASLGKISLLLVLKSTIKQLS